MKTVLLFLSCLMAVAVHSQIIAELQPLNYNPSFAGEANTPRISSNVSRNAATYDAGSVEYYSRLIQSYISFDQPIERLNAGIGVQIRHNHQLGKLDAGNSSSIYPVSKERYTSLSLVYSQKINLTSDVKIIPALELGYFYSNDLKPIGYSGSTHYSYPEAIPSVLVRYKSFFAGGYVAITGRHRTGNYQVQLGHTYALDKNEDVKIRTFINHSSWNTLIERRFENRLAVIGEYKWLVLGLGSTVGNYSQFGTIEPIIGATCKGLQATYSTLIRTQSMPNGSSNKHELGIKFLFNKPKDNKDVTTQ